MTETNGSFLTANLIYDNTLAEQFPYLSAGVSFINWIETLKVLWTNFFSFLIFYYDETL